MKSEACNLKLPIHPLIPNQGSPWGNFMKCILGGTFSIIHSGHERLLNAALAFDEIAVGLTSDKYADANKIHPAVPYEERKRNLENFLQNKMKKTRIKRKLEVMKIEDKYGFAPQTEADAIIVSTETEKVAEEINHLRAFNFRKPLRVISIPLAYADDYIKISSQRISGKKITLGGKRLKPIIFALGSLNPSKKQGLEKAAKRLFRKFVIKAMKAESEISEQPFDEETVEGAVNRAKAAYTATDADFGIGFESGIFKMGENNLHDIVICAIFDGEKITLGNSMGFQMPSQAIQMLKKGGFQFPVPGFGTKLQNPKQFKDLGAVMAELSGIAEIGYKKGAIHYLSAGLLDRQMMNEQAFLCAMIPRISEAKNVFRYF